MTPRRAAVAAAALVAVSVAAVVAALNLGTTTAQRLAGPAGLVEARDAAEAPELAGIAAWHNTPPTTLKALRGRVVVVDFWTYTCINCRRTFPFLRRMHETYAPRGLTLLGVHTPEFDFERIPSNVDRAVRELDVSWPVAQDPDRVTWKAFGNRYWPAKYLIDREGRLRGSHIGEGNEEVFEDQVRALLDEGGSAGETRVGTVDAGEKPGRGLTAERYLGAERGIGMFGGPGPVPPSQTKTRADEGDTRDLVYLTGEFTGNDQWVVAAAPGAEVRLRHNARDVYALLAPERGFGPVEVEVLLDGAAVPVARRGRDVVDRGGRTLVVVDSDDLRHVLTGPAVAEGRLTLRARAAGVRFVTFTFGG